MTTPSSSSPSAESALRATRVELVDEAITAHLVDGRVVRAPFTRRPRLAPATPDQRARRRWTGRGTGIHWPLLDEGVLVFSLAHPDQTTAARVPTIGAAHRRAS